MPPVTDLHTFYATASGYVTNMGNDTLVLNAFGSTTNIEYASNQISLTQGQWVPFYIQFQSIINQLDYSGIIAEGSMEHIINNQAVYSIAPYGVGQYDQSKQ